MKIRRLEADRTIISGLINQGIINAEGNVL